MIVQKNNTNKTACNYLIDSSITGCFIVYCFEARYYRAPTFTSRDPLFEKYFWMSPYAYCANNPVKFVDPTGMEVDITTLIHQDNKNKTNNLSKLTASLTKLTGLNFSSTQTTNGITCLTYEKDANGNPIINTDNNGKQIGSEEARQMIISAIDNSTETVGVRGVTKEEGSQVKENGILLDFKQIEAFINGVSNGLNSETMGYGMTFLHELDHTTLGSSTTHSLREKNGKELGSTVKRMNTIRMQLGTDYGQRLSYPAVHIKGNNYVPFDNNAEKEINNKRIPSGGFYIRF